MKISKTLQDHYLQTLRSGNYKQGQGTYFQDGCHCAAGAILHNAAQKGLISAQLQTEHDWAKTRLYPFLEELDMYAIEIDGLDLATFIFSKNDAGQTFEQIADWLEHEVFPNA